MKTILSFLFKQLCSLVIIFLCVCTQLHAQVCGTLTVNSVSVTNASCPSAGGITVNATGTGLTYQLISGPAGYSTASNTTGMFSTLTAGSYVIEIRDACSIKTTRNATVTNSYPAFSITSAALSNVCTSGVQGGNINANIAGGNAPYQYDIVLAGSAPVYGAFTTSTSFNKAVTAFGTYRVFAKDNCGEVRTYDIILQPLQPEPAYLWWSDVEQNRPCAETMGGLPTITWNLHFQDTSGTGLDFNNLLGSTYQIYRPAVANSITQTQSNCAASLGALLTSGTVIAGNIPMDRPDTYPVTIPQEDVILIFTTRCGKQLKVCYNFNDGDPITPLAIYRFIQQSCGASWNNQDITISNKYVFNMSAPYTFVLTKNNSTTIINSNGIFINLKPNDFPLSIQVTDACGRTATNNFTMPVQGSSLQFSVGPEWGLSCTTVKNTTTAEIIINGGDLPGWADATNVVITGGTVTAVPTISPYNDWIPGYIASNLLAGYSYKVLITNLCGEKDSVQFTVPADHWGQRVLNWNMTASVNALCGANKSTVTADANFTGYNVVNYYLYNVTTPNTVIANNTTGIFENVVPGNYKVKFIVPSPNWPCPGLDIRDSVNVTVLADGANQTITRKTITTCEVNSVPTLSGKAIIEVSGSAPFTYEIIKTSLIGTGGEVWNLSSSGNPNNFYTWDIPTGADPSNTVYTLRTTDKCGNKITTQASLQPINPPAILAQNHPCIGTTDYTLTLNPYGGNFTYKWVKMPDEATTLSTQNSITFSGPYNATYDGNYRCYATLNGCVERYTDVNINSAECNNALPVKLVWFNGNYNNKVAALNWLAESEINFKQYEVERSLNGRDFIKINIIAAKGNNAVAAEYTVTDNIAALTEKIIYYRLKVVDKDGKYTYSSVVKLNLAAQESSIAVYPNPVSTASALSFTSDITGKALIKIIDKTGSVLLTDRINVNKGNNAVKLPGTQNLLPGAYMLQVQTAAGMKAIKIIKL
jgi:hypothetical protein